MFKYFAVRDMKAEHFLKPFVDTSTANAIRGFSSLANEEKSAFNQFPDDFCLYELGSFDEQSGSTEILASPVNLGPARQFVRSQSVVSQ